ncbi:flagellar protein FlaG [Halomonas nitroreducens]|uniref:Flagellar protein FlaG n=1 Tax=Halomonas nitroreducens TaxID=447425 RepID=A0A3S0HQE6_9GAMM|nr:flagellar protein FlaG [Halomonas nitroreducens]RTR04407.1 flagellar protein FlaG [Halomonas nitroreducens]
MTSPLSEIPSRDGIPRAEGTTARHRVTQALDTLPSGEPGQNAATPTPQHGELVAPVQRINQVMRSYGVEFELHEGTSRLVTRLVDRDTGELIRQIPAEEVLRIAERLDELQGKLIQLEA